MSAPLPVLFLSFGGPDGPDDILPFLEIVTRGRGIPRERLLGVAEHYRHMGGKSPINEITRRQADGLRAALAAAGDARKVYLGQRNWHPFIEEALKLMRADGVKEALAFCTAPYRCEASLERYVEAVAAARAAVGPDAPVIRFVGPWFDHPAFVDAIVARVREKTVPADAPWIFTAHSIPCAMAKSSAYVEELRAVAGLVAARLGRKDWSLAYTSRSGNPRDAWLEPDISKVIAAAAQKGVKDLFLIPIGFVADHVEVLYDLDVEAKAAADKLGVRLHRAGTVGDHPDFARMIAQVVRAGAPADAAAAESSAVSGADPARCYCFPGEAEPPCRRAPAPGGRPSRP